MGVFFAATSKDVAKRISCRWEIVDAKILAQIFGNLYFVVLQRRSGGISNPDDCVKDTDYARRINQRRVANSLTQFCARGIQSVRVMSIIRIGKGQ